MIEQYTSPAVVNNSQEPWLVGEGVSFSGSIAIPSLDFNFVTNAFPGTVTFSRASSATFFDSAGVLQSAAINVPRLDYDPATLLPRGFLVEEQRTNSIRNNTGVGAVAGTPGTLPTNWQQNSGAVAVNVVGTGTENGIAYIDLQFVGTPNQNFANIRFDTNTQIVAANGQTWTSSFFVRSVAGSTSNITNVYNRIYFRDAAGIVVQEIDSSIFSFLSNSAINNSRTTNSQTAANASIERVSIGINIGLTVGAAIDITLRIGLPQLELGAFATSVIPTTTTALTRSADVAAVNTLSPWYRADEGTLFAEATSTGYVLNVGFPLLATFDDGTNNNRITVFQGGTSNSLWVNLRKSAVNTTLADTNVDLSATPAKIAGGFSDTTVSVSVNGQSILAGTTNGVPSGMTALYLGSRSLYLSSLNGYLRRITYYPRRLSNAELQAITA